MSKATSLVKNPGSRGLRGAAVKKRRPGPANTAGHLRAAGRTGDVFRDSGDRYQSLFEQTTDAVILTDMESGAILEANPACAAMFGYPRESMKGMLHETLQPESRRNEYKERFCEHLKQAEIFTDDLVYRGADGGEIPVNITSAIFTMNGKRVVQNILRATAGLNSVVTKMMESEDKFSRAFHASPDAISISDLVDGTFIEINESYTKITGYTREEIIGKNAENFNMWATREDRDKMLEPLLRHEKLNNLEVNVRSRSGSINTMLVSTEYVQISGRPCLLVASTDITEYKLTKQALKESEEKFSATFQAIPESVSISRVSDGVFIDVNKNFCRQRGLTREQVIGHTSREIGFWGTPGERERMIQEIREKGKISSREFTLDLPSGEKQTSLISADIINISGEPCMIIISTDITDRKRMEKVVAASEERFSRAFQAIPESIVISKVSTSEFLDANENFCRAVGYSREQIIGKTSEQLNLPERLNNRDGIIRSIKEQGPIINRELEFKMKTGEVKTRLYSADIIDIGGEQCLISVSNDISERKRMEKALKASEEKFSRAFRSIPESIAISRVQDGIFLDVNDSFCRALGLSHDEVIGHNSAELGLTEPPERRAQIIKTIQTQGGITNREIVTRNKAGKVRTTLFSADIIDIDGEPCMISMSTDITERKRMEEALKASEEKFAKAFRSVPESIAISRVSDGVILDANDNFCQIAGRSRDEIIGHTDRELNLPHAPGNREQDIKTIREKGGIRNREMIFNANTKNMTAILFSADIIDYGGDACIISISTNITDRKRMEEALADEDVRRRLLIEQSRDGIVIIDQTGKVYEANRRFAEMHGYTPEEVLKLHVWDWEKSLPPERLLENIQIRDDKGANFEARHMRKDGSFIDVEVSSNGTKYAGQKLVFSVIRDISGRKQMENAIRESEQKFAQAFTASPISLSITRLRDAVYLEVNESFLRDKGYKRHEVIGKSTHEVTVWTNPTESQKLVADLRAHGAVHNVTMQYITRSGQKRTGLVSAELIRIANEDCMLVLNNDITQQQRMEQALRESEEKFHRAFQTIPEAISISRLRDGLLVDVNESFCRRNDLTREEIIGHTSVELGFMAQSSRGDRDYDAKYVESHLENVEFEFKVKNGEIHTVLVSSDVFNIGGEPHILSIGNDITDRKRMEVALRESEEKFSKAFHAIPEGVSISTIDGGVFLDVNEGFLRAVNLTREQVIGHSADELKLWNTSEEHKKMIRAVIEHGSVVNEERQFVSESGQKITLLFSASIIHLGGKPCIITITNNITERKRMEQALRESEEKFSKAFHAIPESVSITTIDKGIFLDVNESFLRSNHLTREQVIGHSGIELNLWNNPAEHENMVRSVLERGNIVNDERQFVLESGETITLLYSASIMNIAGEPCIITISNNISVRKQTEEQLKKALAELQSSTAQLKATNKELESFSYSISHDLRSPLRSIDGFSQALLEDYSPQLDETARNYLNRMRGASQKMGDLIDGLLKLSRLTRNEMHYEMVDLSALAHDISTRLQENDPQRSGVFVIAPGLKAAGDAQMLRVLLENLLGNAWKFTGKVPLARIEFGSRLENDVKTFFIKDNGAGFDMAFRDKLFGAFQRLHDTADFPGTGIGLATVLRIINRHGGTIRAEGVVNQGATFYLTL